MLDTDPKFRTTDCALAVGDIVALRGERDGAARAQLCTAALVLEIDRICGVSVLHLIPARDVPATTYGFAEGARILVTASDAGLAEDDAETIAFKIRDARAVVVEGVQPAPRLIGRLPERQQGRLSRLRARWHAFRDIARDQREALSAARR